jgi:FixJ family two-component response regulator
MEEPLKTVPVSDRPGPITRHRLVSIVDDDASMRDAMSFVLQSAGLRTLSFDSAHAFLRDAALTASACVVLDIRMPGINGLDLFRRLTGLPGAPPVILVSAHIDDALEVTALRAGAVACIRKPFTDEVLLQAVHAALRR